MAHRIARQSMAVQYNAENKEQVLSYEENRKILLEAGTVVILNKTG